jgi:hypothetical protein
MADPRQGSDPGARVMVRRVAPPRAARALSTLPRVHYEDAFLLETGPTRDRTAEQWARELLEGAPATTRRALASGWFALGLRLGPSRSERHVLGWQIRRNARDYVILAARSRLGFSAELLFQRRRQAVLYATFLQLRNPLARAVWAGFAPLVHRPVVRYVLGQSGLPATTAATA